MAFFRNEPITDVVRRLNLSADGEAGMNLLARSAVTQARQRVGGAPVEWLFRQTAQIWGAERSFSESCGMVMRMLMTLQGASPGRIPELMRDLASMGQLVKLPTRRERAFPRVVKERPWKYPTAPKMSTTDEK